MWTSLYHPKETELTFHEGPRPFLRDKTDTHTHTHGQGLDSVQAGSAESFLDQLPFPQEAQQSQEKASVSGHARAASRCGEGGGVEFYFQPSIYLWNSPYQRIREDRDPCLYGMR